MEQKEEPEAASKGGGREVLRKIKEPADYSITEIIGGKGFRKCSFHKEGKENEDWQNVLAFLAVELPGDLQNMAL